MVVGPLIVGLVVGFFVWLLGQQAIKRRERKDAIRDLMTYRGDYSSVDFRRALNKVSITFHGDENVRKQIRELNELINSPDSQSSGISRKIVSLIYELCRRNGFDGITEYDIDQSFPEQKQAPAGGMIDFSTPSLPVSPRSAPDSYEQEASKETEQPGSRQDTDWRESR